MDVLGDALVRVEGVNRGWQEQYAGNISAPERRNRGPGPVKAKHKRSAGSHLRIFAIKHLRNGGRKLDDAAVSVRQVRIVDGWNRLNKAR